MIAGPYRVRGFQPHEALASPGMRSAFEALRQSYDVVIVDLSSVLPLVDVCLTAHFNDSYILVAELGGTHRMSSFMRSKPPAGLQTN